ncbi:MAG TPA: DUF5320 domain-containing protein [Syntrophomonadaceae bacterium]|jgi:hypothetical protein|nr:DUF5320 domain-containing protein [Syntrophomonadaceae bacterium]
MPARDGTGPLGIGPMTGRGMGMCIMGADALRRGARAGRAFGRGAAMGFVPGMGRGAGWGLASRLGQGIARGLGGAAILGLGCGFARARRKRAGGEFNLEPEGQRLQRRKKELEDQLASINKRLESLTGSRSPVS